MKGRRFSAYGYHMVVSVSRQRGRACGALWLQFEGWCTKHVCRSISGGFRQELSVDACFSCHRMKTNSSID